MSWTHYHSKQMAFFQLQFWKYGEKIYVVFLFSLYIPLLLKFLFPVEIEKSILAIQSNFSFIRSTYTMMVEQKTHFFVQSRSRIYPYSEISMWHCKNIILLKNRIEEKELYCKQFVVLWRFSVFSSVFFFTSVTPLNAVLF